MTTAHILLPPAPEGCGKVVYTGVCLLTGDASCPGPAWGGGGLPPRECGTGAMSLAFTQDWGCFFFEVSKCVPCFKMTCCEFFQRIWKKNREWFYYYYCARKCESKTPIDLNYIVQFIGNKDKMASSQ